MMKEENHFERAWPGENEKHQATEIMKQKRSGKMMKMIRKLANN